MVRDTLFLERIVEGEITLFSSYTTRPHYFVETSGKDLRELIYFVQRVGPQWSRTVQRARQYRQQLALLRTEACKSASVSQLDFERDELAEFVASCNSGGDFDPDIYASGFRFGHIVSLRGSRSASRHPSPAGPNRMVGFSPGIRYQLMVEMGRRNPVGAVLLGVGVQRMRASRSSERVTLPVTSTVELDGTAFGDLSATVVDVNAEMRFRIGQGKTRPFIGVETAALFPLNYSANLGVRLDPFENDGQSFPAQDFNIPAKDWNTVQIGAGVGAGVEGQLVGARLRFLYGFPVQRVDAQAPRLLDLELQLFLKF